MGQTSTWNETKSLDLDYFGGERERERTKKQEGRDESRKTVGTKRKRTGRDETPLVR